MYKANQEALFQATNQGLINIRQSEVNYYLSVNSAIGTQAALIGGFTYGIFTQNQLNVHNSWSASCQTAYYIVTAVTISSAVHVIINTMLLQVLGPGLALNGPVGSMARATEGMQVEQSQIIWSFSVMIVSFALSTVLSFWVVMDVVASTGSTLVFAMAARFWYFYSKRVFLRFYWDKTKKSTTWAGAAEDDDDEPTIQSKVQPTSISISVEQKSPMHSTGSIIGSVFSQKSLPLSNTPKLGEDTHKKNIKSRRMSAFDWLKPTEKEIRDSLCEADRFAVDELSKQQALQSRDVAMEGYLTKRGVSRSEFVRDPWERRYFVLNHRGQIFNYKSRQDYREDPASRVKGRPIDLEEYLVEVTGGWGLSLNDTASVSMTGTAGSLPAFQITLKPREDESFRQWMLRCDTEEVLAQWLQAMSLVSPQSFPSQGADLV
jgi:hypothetical protein